MHLCTMLASSQLSVLQAGHEDEHAHTVSTGGSTCPDPEHGSISKSFGVQQILNRKMDAKLPSCRFFGVQRKSRGLDGAVWRQVDRPGHWRADIAVSPAELESRSSSMRRGKRKSPEAF
jgi:hypothetical protein